MVSVHDSEAAAVYDISKAYMGPIGGIRHIGGTYRSRDTG